jgi:subtilisin family serine protease
MRHRSRFGDVCGLPILSDREARRAAVEDWSVERSNPDRQLGSHAEDVAPQQPAHGKADASTARRALPTVTRRSRLRRLLPLGCVLLATLGTATGNSDPTRVTSAVPHGVQPVEIAYESPAALRTVLRQHPARLVRVFSPLRVAVVLPLGNPRVFMRYVRRAEGVSSVARPVGRARADSPLGLGLVLPSAEGAYEWQYRAAGIDRVPASVLAAAHAVTIAVIDTGADLSTPDLAGKVVGAYNVSQSNTVVTDESGHGTFVASLAGGSAAYGAGVAGFGGGARVLVVKAAEPQGFTDLDVAAGILYAVHRGARIINLSIAGRTRSPVEEMAIRYAAAHGVLMVAAAGNDALHGDPPEYPAALLQPIGSNGSGGLGLSVGASDLHGNRAPFSESGSFLSLAAPGESVFGAVARTTRSAKAGSTRNPLYGYASGTSFAAPEVAGAAALVWAADPGLSAQEVAGILKQTASGHGAWTSDLGFGVLDAAAAVEQALLTRR